MKPIIFCLNDVSLDRAGRPVEGGQVHRLVEPILPHLDDVDWRWSPQPVENAVNVYYTHRGAFEKVRRETGVFVSHGIADKGWRNGTGDHYRATFVSGPAWSVKLLDHGCPAHRIFEVGYPKLDPLYQARRERQRGDRIVVVWAPTHGGGGMSFAFSDSPPPSFNAKRSSWWHRDEVLAALDHPDIDVVIAPHPRHRRDRQSTFTEYLNADVVIADGGSTIYESWALNIPVVFPSWITFHGNTDGNSRGTMEEDIYRNRIGRHCDDPTALADLVLAAVEDGITTVEQRYVEPILPRRYRGESGRMHAEALIDLAAGVEPPRHSPPPVEWETYTFAGRSERVAVGTKRQLHYARHPQWKLIPNPG